MKSFVINRQVQKEVVHLEYVSEPVEVHFHEISHQDMISMKFDQLRSYASSLRMMMQNITTDIGAVTKQLRNDMDTITVKHDPITSSIMINEPEKDDTDKFPSGQIGKKIGKSSQFHYVYQSKKNLKYHAAIGGNTQAGYVGTSESETDAALAIDSHLDKENDFDRPRNRDEFPEIQELYKIQMNTLKDIA